MFGARAIVEMRDLLCAADQHELADALTADILRPELRRTCAAFDGWCVISGVEWWNASFPLRARLAAWMLCRILALDAGPTSVTGDAAAA